MRPRRREERKGRREGNNGSIPLRLPSRPLRLRGSLVRRSARLSETHVQPPVDREAQFIERFVAAKSKLKHELHKVIVGQEDVLELLLAAIFARGHCLLVGVPGLAKTLMISTLAKVLKLNFNRIQFTPDLMPADITGTDVLEEDQSTGKREFRFVKGPV